ncbi:MAG: hypothetical protein ACRDHF_20050 [Tepidiformaceae bacterium]
MQLSLTADEATLLRNVLDRHLSLLREEIGKTENYQMRQDLKADEALLKGLIARLQTAAA